MSNSQPDIRGDLRSGERLNKVSLFLLCFAVGLVTIYSGGYFALVERDPGWSVSGFTTTSVQHSIVPRYRIGGTVAAKLFYPLHSLDRRLRQEYWNGNGLLYLK